MSNLILLSRARLLEALNYYRKLRFLWTEELDQYFKRITTVLPEWKRKNILEIHKQLQGKDFHQQTAQRWLEAQVIYRQLTLFV